MAGGTPASARIGVAPRRPAAPLVRAVPYGDILAFAASVGLILIFSGSWGAILTDYGKKSADFLRNGYYPGYLLALALVASRPSAAALAVLRSPLLIGLLLLTAASFFWSIAPDLTLRRFPALAFTTLAGVALAARWRWRTLAEIIAVSMAVMAVASFLLGALLPDMGRMQELFPGAWRGLWLEKNGLGNTMVMGVGAMLAAGAMVPERRRLWFALSAVPLALIVLSTSKTALIVLVLSLASMAFVGLVKAGPLRAVIVTWLAVVGVIAAALLITTRSELFFDLLGKDATLTGRTEIWAGAIQQMADHPWRGFGYGAVWDDPNLTGPKAWIGHRANFTPANAHSGWLEIYLGLGLGGVILFAAWLLQVWGQSLWAAYTSPSAWLLMPMMTSYTVTMLSESISMNWHDLRWILFVALALKLALGETSTAAGRVQTPPSPRPTR
ncbi:O-antigen ligase family protein [Brevundimonas naejangsanensis]|uniref:O-antigen ligase family protein n=1 Tax=Brevundimonas naejangsanensis TaxID=588932 RepID=A0A494REG3_9CAUL|nr:O-antigen ligase [Brevundimonas naejangsanensis]AYG93779.1 O-antigen ligase family protein [Brevundimonas naejangsanensis]